MRGLDGITDSTDLSLSKLPEIKKSREAWRAAPRVAKGQTRLSSRLNNKKASCHTLKVKEEPGKGAAELGKKRAGTLG